MIKKNTKDWEKRKKFLDLRELEVVERQLLSISSSEGKGFSSHVSSEICRNLEERNMSLLVARDEEWHQKSKSIWLKSGDRRKKIVLR